MGKGILLIKYYLVGIQFEIIHSDINVFVSTDLELLIGFAKKIVFKNFSQLFKRFFFEYR